MRLICDGCGEILEEADKVKVTNLDHQRWVWKDKWTDHREIVRVGRLQGIRHQRENRNKACPKKLVSWRSRVRTELLCTTAPSAPTAMLEAELV
jgi:hypothetical protein